MGGQWVFPLLATLQLAASEATPLALQPKCSSGKELSVSMSYATNASGHRVVSANLEQPLRSSGWLLDAEVRTSGCGPDDAPRRALTVTLTGPPEAERPGLRAPGLPAPPGYLTLPGLGHYRAPPDAETWYDARDLCRREGGGLVTPSSRHEVLVLLGHFPRNASGAFYENFVWHSANDNKEEGKFVTYDGVPLENTGWAEFGPRNPTSNTDKNCLGIYWDALLYNLMCYKKASFICKVPL
ncbi:hypothetical protein R5R35_004594 [Gryllus longicercus]|uniref:C-type lectin domain-containing protein n=1 Tax=Gryllus longicercus TaxID=2509291 RepID=A0AAN9WST5_9ORTH